MNDTARELYLFISNHAATWAQLEHVARNYERKRKRGVYDSALAAKGLSYCVESGAKAYAGMARYFSACH